MVGSGVRGVFGCVGRRRSHGRRGLGDSLFGGDLLGLDRSRSAFVAPRDGGPRSFRGRAAPRGGLGRAAPTDP